MSKCCGQENYNGDKKPLRDQRQQLMQQIREIIGEADNSVRGRKRVKSSGSGAPSGCCQDLEKECLQYRKRRECTPPLITSLAVHEVRPTSDYDNMRHENTKQLTYVDATTPNPRDAVLDPVPPAPWELPRKPSQELRAGTLYQNCDCTKRNGLQQDCPRMGCGGRPKCLAVNPGPCCEPSKARKPVRGDRRNRRIEDDGKRSWEDKKEPTQYPGTQPPREGYHFGAADVRDMGISIPCPVGGMMGGLQMENLMEAIQAAAVLRGPVSPQVGGRGMRTSMPSTAGGMMVGLQIGDLMEAIRTAAQSGPQTGQHAPQIGVVPEGVGHYGGVQQIPMDSNIAGLVCFAIPAAVNRGQ